MENKQDVETILIGLYLDTYWFNLNVGVVRILLVINLLEKNGNLTKACRPIY